jgi:riboflavin kinase/FMN adenylyltransferase
MPERAALLQDFGADHVLILRTSTALLQLDAREFFQRIIIDGLNAKSLVEGFNFGFGRNREGTIDVLKSLCTEKNVALSLVPPQEVAGQVVSTSRVRRELTAGRVDVARQMLGRPYRIAGVVRPGAKRGASIGFPTANLHDVPTLVPGNGVYAVTALIEGMAWPGAANVGPNPTFGEHARKIETHLIGFEGQLYDQRLCVEFVQKIRDTLTFASVADLKAQIQRDIDMATSILS